MSLPKDCPHFPVTAANALSLVTWLRSEKVPVAEIARYAGASESSVYRFINSNGTAGHCVRKGLVAKFGAAAAALAAVDDAAVVRPRPLADYRILSYKMGKLSYSEFWRGSEWRSVRRIDTDNIPNDCPVVYEFGVREGGVFVAKYLGSATSCVSGTSKGYFRKRFGEYASKGDKNGNNPHVVKAIRDPDSGVFVRWRRIDLSNDPKRAASCGAAVAIERELLILFKDTDFPWNKRI